MRRALFLLAGLLALAGAGCARQQQPAYHIVDPATGQPVPVVRQYQQPQYQQPQYQQHQYQQTYAQQQPAQDGPAEPHGRGLFTSHHTTAYASQTYTQPAYTPRVYAQPKAAQNGYVQQQRYGQGYVLQYRPPQQAVAARSYAAATARHAYAYAPANVPYTLDSGDRLRIVVFGQEGITGSYLVDAGGQVNLPLIGAVPARGLTTRQLTATIAERLKQGYVREPHVTAEIEAYRPFFILGEVTNPGQYPYVVRMTAEKAVAIAGGFAPRANKKTVELTRNGGGQHFKGDVPLNYPLRPGDTVVVKERWF
jgi:polysaccharide export outer membrane protein